MISKTCFKCQCEKPLSEFYAHRNMADGHLNKCKDCTRTDAAAHRHGGGREKVLAYDRQRAKSPERKAKASATVAEWRLNFPDRRSAQVALGNAVRNAQIKPWPTCALPNCDKKPEAHHADYSRPLDVVWLCAAHHKQAHALHKRAA